MRLTKDGVSKLVRNNCLPLLSVLLCMVLPVLLPRSTLTTIQHTRIISDDAHFVGSVQNRSLIYHSPSDIRQSWAMKKRRVSLESKLRSRLKIVAKGTGDSCSFQDWMDKNCTFDQVIEQGRTCLMKMSPNADLLWSNISNQILKLTGNERFPPIKSIGVLLGAMKSGTTEFREYVTMMTRKVAKHRDLDHPMPNTVLFGREIHFFDAYGGQSSLDECQNWMRVWQRYPLSLGHHHSPHGYSMIRPTLNGEKAQYSVLWEKTPVYATMPKVAVFYGAMQRYLNSFQSPSIKLRLWMVVRNPSARLYSQYYHKHHDSPELRNPSKFTRECSMIIQQWKKSKIMMSLMEQVNRTSEELKRSLENKSDDDSSWDVDSLVSSYIQLCRKEGTPSPLRRGFYAMQIAMYMRALGVIDSRGKLLSDVHCFKVIQSEYHWKDIHRSTRVVLNWIYGMEVIPDRPWVRFIRMEHKRRSQNRRRYEPAEPSAIQMISEFYRIHNTLLSLIWKKYQQTLTFGNEPFLPYN